MNEQRLQQLRERHKHNMSPAQLNDLANLIDALMPDTKTGTDSWPPSGVAIEVSNDAQHWNKRVSAGNGEYYSGHDGNQIAIKPTWTYWRYAPAPWQNVSHDMRQWAVFSDGTTYWSTDSEYWHMGDEYNGSTVVHVESRQEDV
jgi:hypothetical protein